MMIEIVQMALSYYLNKLQKDCLLKHNGWYQCSNYTVDFGGAHFFFLFFFIAGGGGGGVVHLQ